MHHRLMTRLAACALAPLAIAAAPAAAQLVQQTAPAHTLNLSIGRGELVTLPAAMSDVFIANEAIADVQVKSQRQLYVFGRSGGTTTIYASDAAGAVVWSADIRVGANIDNVDQMLALAMPDARIGVAMMSSNTVLLTGVVAAPQDAAEAERLVKAFLGEEAQVVSRLKLTTPLQVNLRVRFAEVSRSLVRALNTRLATRDQTNGISFGVNRGNPGTITGGDVTGTQVMIDPCDFYKLGCTSELVPFDPITGEFVTGNTTYNFEGAAGSTSIGLAGKLLGLDILGTLDVGETMGLVTTLSEPNLTALSGETAEFLAGGEFPIPLGQGLGTTTIEYKNYGVSLAYTPTVLSNGRISMRVRPEVSELTTQGAIVLDGFQVPALTVRRAETTVELGSGQSFMIAGLLSSNANNTIEKAPGAGDIPILGNLFRSTDFRRGETELVIVVTPYLVRPVDDREIRLPTDGFATPSLAEQFFLNREAGTPPAAIRPMPQEAPQPGVPETGSPPETAPPATPQPAQPEE